MQLTTFYLVPDRFSAGYLRKEFTKKHALLGCQIGTWNELLELARLNYCCSLPEENWQENLESSLTKVKGAFWTKSYRYDPENTSKLISDSLIELLKSLGPSIKRTKVVSKKISERGRMQLCNLFELHDKMSCVLPRELELIQMLLGLKKKRALKGIRVHYLQPIVRLNPWQECLVTHLNSHVIGEADLSQELTLLYEQFLSWDSGGSSVKGLSHLQKNLFGRQVDNKATLLSGMQWLSVRDYLQEIEVVAGIIQVLGDKQKVKPCDIGVLIPKKQSYTQSLKDIFDYAGIPLSGLELTSCQRDHAKEFLYNFLLCRRSISPSPMLLASICCSPLLPWKDDASLIAQKVMDGMYLPTILKQYPEEHQKTGWVINGRQVVSVDGLIKALKGLLVVVNKGNGSAEMCGEAKTLILSLLAYQHKNEDVDWEDLLRMCRPNTVVASESVPINLEGVKVFYSESEPWQKVKHLFVLGFTEGQYPQNQSTAIVIPDADRVILNNVGVPLKTLEESLYIQRLRFKRQIFSAKQSITFTLPKLDGAGNRQSPSSTLGYIAQLFNINASEDLLLDLEIENDQKKVKNLPIITGIPVTHPRKLFSKDLELGENLLTKRKDRRGETAAESPSGLEKLMVSPLAWLFNRYGISSKEWSPEGMDVLVIGSIAHGVLEKIFHKNEPLPQRGRIAGRVEKNFKDVLEADYPYLLTQAWQVERKENIKMITEAALAWYDYLVVNKLEVIAEEEWLRGRFNRHPIHGKADLICRSDKGELLVVDYKTSKSTNRKKMMEKGFDHQGTLYSQMLGTGAISDEMPVKLKNQLKKSSPISTLYYTLRDQTVLGDSSAATLKDTEVVNQSISSNSFQKIKERMSDIRKGRVSLNRVGDDSLIKDTTGVTPYALGDSPLIGIFMIEEDE